MEMRQVCQLMEGYAYVGQCCVPVFVVQLCQVTLLGHA